jgi:hypothetical protein
MKGRIDIPIIFAASLVCISVVTPDPAEITKSKQVVSQKLELNGLANMLQYALITIASSAGTCKTLTKDHTSEGKTNVIQQKKIANFAQLILSISPEVQNHNLITFSSIAVT